MKVNALSPVQIMVVQHLWNEIM